MYITNVLLYDSVLAIIGYEEGFPEFIKTTRCLSSQCSSNSEAKASELLGNCKEMHRDVLINSNFMLIC